MPDFLKFAPSVETPAPDEHVIFDELSRTMQHIARTMASRTRHAARPVHAKSHGILVGTFEVLPNLSPELAQGLFATPATYPVVFRFSTNPGDILADSISSPRGLAIKVLNVPGEQLPTNPGATTQDFVCINQNAFAAPDPAGFLKGLKQLDDTLTLPEPVKHAVSVAARATNAVIGLVGLHSGQLEGLGAPATHPLGESFSTVAPLRYGQYVAKIGFAPASENLAKLKGESISIEGDYNALEELIKKFFRQETGVWEVKVQLALAEDAAVEEKDRAFPIEVADKVWPEDKSPWQVVARITMPPQDTYSDARQLHVDEMMSFNPWHGLVAHQPLGGIMRSRKKAYEEASKYRAIRNGRTIAEPKDISEIPA